MKRIIELSAVAAAFLLLVPACGGSGSSTSNPTFTVGGVVSGLTGTVVLRDNGVDNLAIITNGTFTFSTPLANGAAYAVTVNTQPSCGTCTVTNGTGTVSGANVTTVSVACAAAPAGTLDITFGGAGMVTTSFSTHKDEAYAVAVQSDGKIVAAGQYANGTNNDVALARYNSDGTLDTAFGTNGKVTTAIGSGDDKANAVAIQSDGKIVAAGYSSNGTIDVFALVRYNANGSLDTAFGTNGKVTTTIGNLGAEANAVAIQPSDGKIVAAGWSSSSSGYVFALVRYNTDGSLDTNFGGTGKVTTEIQPLVSSDDRVNAVVIQPSDGKIVAAGYTSHADGATGATNAFALVRYNTNGALDTTFNGSGIVMTAPRTGFNDVNALAIQSNDGKIVAAGTSSDSTGYYAALARYNYSDGTLDTAFGTNGKVTTAIVNGDDKANNSVAIQSDGKIATGGYSYNGTAYVFSIKRFNSDGSLDTAFGTNGHADTWISGSPLSDYAYAAAIQPDGKIVAAGIAGVNNNDFGLARYCQ